MIRASVLVATVSLVSSLASSACNTTETPDPSAKATAAPAPTAAPKTESESVLRLGAPIGGAPAASLAEVVKAPDAFTGKRFTTTGTVSAVCQHRGCWMEIKDESGEAHVKMAGHSFFVPRSAAGKKARVMGRLVAAPEPAGMCDGAHEAAGKGCRAEAEQQLGRPLAKLELVADGVEIL